ncbi:MAG: ubiquinone/menaquinone biosynthesis C-methylase UbiE [Myxococcota bacterium]|jgi:ubiquinone/menaquinone biosynthesis C-methylase UbiE
MTLLFALLGCDPAETPDPVEPAEHTEEGHSAHQMHGELAGRPHDGGDHATVTHRFDDAEKWAAVFDDPARDAWQKPAELIAALGIVSGSVAADIGAGTGYFNPHLSRAVGDQGRVIAVDIEQSLVEHMTQRAATEGTANVSPRLGKAADPGLEADEVDLILLVDTYHHIEDRTAYFTRLLSAVRPGGRLVVVDFKPGDIPVGPPEDHRIPQDKVVAELTAAGWGAGESLEVLPHQFVQVMVKAPPH